MSLQNFKLRVAKLSERYPSEFDSAIKAFESALSNVSAKRYNPNKHLYKLVNTLSSSQKTSALKSMKRL